MNEPMHPFSVTIDLRRGSIEPEPEVVERRLSAMRDAYLEPHGDGDPLIYRVYSVPAPATNSNVLCCTTVIEPGTVGREYFMTKGHFHEVRDRAEAYLCLSGEGRLVMATEDGASAVEPMTPGTMNYVPGGWAHRSVNVGEEPLVFFAAYIGDAGHDYGTIEERGFPVVVVKGSLGPEIAENPRYQR